MHVHCPTVTVEKIHDLSEIVDSTMWRAEISNYVNNDYGGDHDDYDRSDDDYDDGNDED